LSLSGLSGVAFRQFSSVRLIPVFSLALKIISIAGDEGVPEPDRYRRNERIR
jgi:hypothetical protein